MKKIAFIAAMAALALTTNAAIPAKPTFTEWHNLQVNQVNRLKMHTSFFAYESAEKALKGDMKASDNFFSLHGQWKFNWVEHADPIIRRQQMGKYACARHLGTERIR